MEQLAERMTEIMVGYSFLSGKDAITDAEVAILLFKHGLSKNNILLKMKYFSIRY